MQTQAAAIEIKLSSVTQGTQAHNQQIQEIVSKNKEPTTDFIGDDLIAKYILKTFMFQAKQGAVVKYYKRDDGTQNLLREHVIQATSRAMQRLDHFKDVDEYTLRQTIISRLDAKHVSLKPIMLSKEYFRPTEGTEVWVGDVAYPNVWRESLVVPNNKRDAQPFIDFMHRMTSTEGGTFIIRLLAYKFQYPLRKPHHALYLYHLEGGYGKGTLAEIMEAVYGSSSLKQGTVKEGFGSLSGIDLWKRTWLIADEMPEKASDAIYSYLKDMTGRQKKDGARKNEHFQKHEVPANLIVFSNNPPSFLPSSDRRFFVSEFHHEFEDDDARAAYMAWFRDWAFNKGGVEAVAHYLGNLDVDDYNEAQQAPRTEEWRRCTGMQEDDDAITIRNFISDLPQQHIFEDKQLKEMLAHLRSDQERKSVLSKAGLVKEKDRVSCKMDNKQKMITVWVREGQEIKRYTNGTMVEPAGVSLQRQAQSMPLMQEDADAAVKIAEALRAKQCSPHSQDF